MNYNHDTEMDIDWAADQMRREKNLGSSLPDTPIRLTTATLPPRPAQATLQPNMGNAGIVTPDDATLGSALSALAINAHNSEHCFRICDNLLTLLSDRDRVTVHAEFAQLKGVEAVLNVVKEHGGDTALMALRILDKLSRTSAREISAAGGIDVLVRCCEKEGQAPRLIEAALRGLQGLTFDDTAKLLLLRRGVRELAEGVVEAKPGVQPGENGSPEEDEANANAWRDVISISMRLLHRLGGSQKGQLGLSR